MAGICAGRKCSVGSVGDSYDNALAETINGLYKAELSIDEHDCWTNQLRRTRAVHPSSGRKDKLMRVTTASQERFSSCGYTRSKQ